MAALPIVEATPVGSNRGQQREAQGLGKQADNVHMDTILPTIALPNVM